MSWRERHPDRATYQRELTNIRGQAQRTIAHRHPAEYELEIQRLCLQRGLPRFLPPLEPELDGRRREARGAA